MKTTLYNRVPFSKPQVDRILDAAGGDEALAEEFIQLCARCNVSPIYCLPVLRAQRVNHSLGSLAEALGDITLRLL